jgi:hypothetical protein
MKRGDFLAVAALAALYVGLHLPGLGRPFLRHMESNGAAFGKFAIPMLRFGLGTTRLGILDVSGPRLDYYGDHRPYFYPNHPPLPYWLVAASCAILGFTEAAIRLVPLAAGVVNLLLFAALARRVLGPPWHLIATALFALNPMFAYHSVASIDQPVLLAALLACLLFFWTWRTEGRRSALIGALASGFVACWTEWPGYFLAIVAGVHLFAVERNTRLALVPLVLAALSAGIYLLFLVWLDPETLQGFRGLFGAGGSRAFGDLPLGWRYPFGEAREIGLYFTVGLVLPAGVWLAAFLRSPAPRRREDLFVLSLAALGLHEVLLVPYSAAHDYLTFTLLPFFALAGASGLRILWSAPVRKAGRAAVAALLALFAAQSAWVLADRLTREGALEFYLRMATVLRESTPRDARIVVLGDNMLFYTPFYHDRYTVTWSRALRRLHAEYRGPFLDGVDEDRLKAVLSENREGYDYAIIPRKDRVVEHVGYFRRAGVDPSTAAGDRLLASFGAVGPEEPLYRFLETRFGRPALACGFAVFAMR